MTPSRPTRGGRRGPPQLRRSARVAPAPPRAVRWRAHPRSRRRVAPVADGHRRADRRHARAFPCRHHRVKGTWKSWRAAGDDLMSRVRRTIPAVFAPLSSRRPRPRRGTGPTRARPLAEGGCDWRAGRTGRPGSAPPVVAPAPTARAVRRGRAAPGWAPGTRVASSVTSISAHDSNSRAAFSADVVRRSSSAKDSHSSGGASGMKLEVKNRRNAGSSRPHPRRTISTCRAASRRCSSVAARRKRPWTYAPKSTRRLTRSGWRAA